MGSCLLVILNHPGSLAAGTTRGQTYYDGQGGVFCNVYNGIVHFISSWEVDKHGVIAPEEGSNSN
ncbi:hypothetical protein CCP3SC15_840005 [Gammaproteobacteria bacterium]